MKEIKAERLAELTDRAAELEAQRLLTIIMARRHQMNRWLGIDGYESIAYDENSALAMGMLALFRYARGASVPGPLVQSFLDELLELMFSGLASGVMVLPPFHRMQDRPWAIAWRMAELRLAAEGGIELESEQFAHLMGISPLQVKQVLTERGVADTLHVPVEILQEWLQSVLDLKNATREDLLET